MVTIVKSAMDADSIVVGSNCHDISSYRFRAPGMEAAGTTCGVFERSAVMWLRSREPIEGPIMNSPTSHDPSHGQ
jgi:hypothetical protein